jgi:C4-dicarboxylate transporter DctM subunit
MIALVGSFFLAVVLGIPISVAIGVASVFYLLLYGSVSLAVIAQQMTIGIDSFPLLAIPLFLLAGLLMSEANITERIIGFANALVGRIAGGLATVMVTCMFFGAISARRGGRHRHRFCCRPWTSRATRRVSRAACWAAPARWERSSRPRSS